MKAILCTPNYRIPVELAEDPGGLIFVVSQKDGRQMFYLEPDLTGEFPQSNPLDWVYGTDDLPENIEPQRRPRITVNDLRPGDSEYNWKLIVERFPWLFAKDFEYKQATKYAEQVSGQKMTAIEPGSPAGQLAADVAACLPILDQVVNKGRLVYGHQARIAEALGITNEGGNRKRILAVRNELLKRGRAA